MADNHGDLLKEVMSEFNEAADLLNLEPDIRERLSHPRRILIVSCPIHMDDGTVKTFEGYRVQWAASPVSPDGGNVFLEGGISAKISSLILYYQVENITGAGMRWFGVYSVQGRNSVWGVRWNLHN